MNSFSMPDMPIAPDNILANGFFAVNGGASVMLDEGSARDGFHSDMEEVQARAAFPPL
jgi:hypothetical protein